MPIIRLHFFRAEPATLPGLLGRCRFRLATAPGLAFARLLATAGPGFTNRQFTPRRWAVLTVGEPAADDWALRPVVARVPAYYRLDLELTSSQGSWKLAEPLGRPQPPRPQPPRVAAAGPVAVLTHARVRPAAIRRFWGAVPAVAETLDGTAGLHAACAIGEAPLVRSGTFSVWSDARAVQAFVASPAHAVAIRRRAVEHWYAEELFASFRVLATVGDATLIATRTRRS